MKIEGLIANVTAIGPPTGAESAVFWVILDFDKFGHFCDRGSHFVICRQVSTFLGPKNLRYVHASKKEWLIANITAVGPSKKYIANAAFFCYF